MLPARVLLLLGSLGVAASAAAAPDAPLLLAQADPASMDDLFGSDEPEESAPQDEDSDDSVVDDAQPGSVDELFGEEPATASSPARTASPDAPVRLTGFYDNKLAYTYEEPEHWSRLANTLELSLDGRNGPIEWKLSGRAVYDAVFEFENFYPEEVEDDQEFEFTVRESYIDFSQGDWDLRLGRQHIIWGEMVGLFFADVVSAKDLREFVLQDFDLLRIPQWAARVEYFKDDLHAELVWIPYMTYNNVGKPGAEFFEVVLPESFPEDGLRFVQDQPQGIDDGAYGARLTYLVNGWDLAAFYYNSRDALPAFERTISFDPQPLLSLTEVHERIDQAGATLAKDFGGFVLKAEAIYTSGRPFTVTDVADVDGLVEQDLLDYVVGLEWAFADEGRFNLQFFQRWFPDHDDAMIPDELESGASVLLTRRFATHWEPELLWITSVDRNDSLLRAKLTWLSGGSWTLGGGVDVFNGDPGGLFGTYDSRDRVYTELRVTF
jgi:hypothetical protein